jgi:hypothetical protein
MLGAWSMSWRLGVTYVGKLHPGQELAAQHLLDALAQRRHKGGQVDVENDPARLSVLGPLVPAQTLHGVGAREATVRVHDQDDLLSLVGKRLQHATNRACIIGEALGRGLRSDRRVVDRLGLPAAGLEGVPDEVKAVRGVPGPGSKDDGWLGGRGHCVLSRD